MNFELAAAPADDDNPGAVVGTNAPTRQQEEEEEEGELKPTNATTAAVNVAADHLKILEEDELILIVVAVGIEGSVIVLVFDGLLFCLLVKVVFLLSSSFCRHDRHGRMDDARLSILRTC